MADARRRSPLQHRRPVEREGVARLVEHRFLGKLVLRGAPEALAGPLEAGIGTRGPDGACRATSSDGRSVLWIGPDERWLIVPAETEGAVRDRLAGEMADDADVVDVTDYYVAIGLSGPRAWEMLAKLTPLDVDPAAFGEGAVAGTIFARAQATLWRPAPEAGLDSDYVLLVRASMADYLWCLLAEAGREWNMPEQVPVAGEPWRLAR